MKAIFIDVKSKCLEEIEIGDSLQDLYDVVNCNFLDLIKPVNLSDHALLCDATAAFETVDTLKGGFKSDYLGGAVVFGNAVVVGIDDAGVRTDCTLSVVELLDHIQFCDEEELKEEFKNLNKSNSLDLGW